MVWYVELFPECIDYVLFRTIHKVFTLNSYTVKSPEDGGTNGNDNFSSPVVMWMLQNTQHHEFVFDFIKNIDGNNTHQITVDVIKLIVLMLLNSIT